MTNITKHNLLDPESVVGVKLKLNSRASPNSRCVRWLEMTENQEIYRRYIKRNTKIITLECSSAHRK